MSQCNFEEIFLLETNKHEKKGDVFCWFPVLPLDNNDEQTIIEIFLSIFSCFTLNILVYECLYRKGPIL